MGGYAPEHSRSRGQESQNVPCHLFRTDGTAGWSARGSLSSIGGREEWFISEISAQIGFLTAGSLSATLPLWNVFKERLRELGYIEG